MFKYAVLLTVCVVRMSAGIDDDDCDDGVPFNHHIMDKKILNSRFPVHIGFITDMVYNIKENLMYVIQSHLGKSSVGYFNTENETAVSVHKTNNGNDIVNPTCLAIDQWDNIVYVGSPDGIFLINAQSIKNPGRLPVILETTHPSVQSLYLPVSEKLYYTDSMNKLWMFEKGYIDPVDEFLNVAAEKIVMYSKYIFFTRSKSVYRMNEGEDTVYTYDQFNGKVLVLVADIGHTPYITTNEGVYQATSDASSFIKVADIKNVVALTFNEAGEPTYIAGGEAYRLKMKRCPLAR